MNVKSINLKQFRCFQNKIIDFSYPIILLEGPNASGKTSILEALHYSCYLRSFRTRNTRELIHFDAKSFAIKLEFSSENPPGEKISILSGYSTSPKKRIVKINNKLISSHKELLENYRVITITNEDMSIITGYPDSRRTFMDQMILLMNPDYSKVLKLHSEVLLQRNALLNSYKFDRETYNVWTEQLNKHAQTIRDERISWINLIEEKTNKLLESFKLPPTIKLKYKTKNPPEDLERQESIMKRSLIGAHLDDLIISFNDKFAKLYSSKGQQKLIATLLKLASYKAQDINLFLFDDILSELDKDKVTHLFGLLNEYKTQCIITSPQNSPLLKGLCESYKGKIIALD